MLLIKVDESPGFAMKLPGTMEGRGNWKKLGNLLMNTLGIDIEIEENVKGEWIFKVKNTGGRGQEQVAVVSKKNQEQVAVVSKKNQEQVAVVSKKNQEGGVKYKLNESWIKRVNEMGEQRKESNEKVECFKYRKVSIELENVRRWNVTAVARKNISRECNVKKRGLR